MIKVFTSGISITDWLTTTFRSLKYRNYRLFFIGQGLSLIGTWMQRIALPWLVYSLTGSVWLLGLVGFISQVPTFLFAPVAGVLTDRWNRYHMLVATQVLAMLQALILTILYFTAVISVWHILVLGSILGIINAFDMPARQSFLIDMVEGRQNLGNAIALNSSMVNSARLIGPAIAGVLIAATNEGVCFLANTVSFVFIIGSLLMMRFKSLRPVQVKTNVFKGLMEGSVYAFGFPPIRAIILMLGLTSLVGMPFTVLMPAYAKEILHGGSHTFGFLMGAMGIGALAAALFLASRTTMIKLGKIIPLSAFIFGLGILGLSLSKVFPLSLIFMLLAGCGMIMGLAGSNTILQTIVDDNKRGRVMSFYTMAIMGITPFGSLLAGQLAKSIGTSYTLTLSGLLSIVGAAVFASKLPALKKQVRPVYEKMKQEEQDAAPKETTIVI